MTKNEPVITEIGQNDSKKIISLQLTDVIVNDFSKKEKCLKLLEKVKLLNPKIYCLLDKTVKEYIKE